MLRGAHRAFRKLPRHKASVNKWHLHFAQPVQQTTGLGRCHLSSTGAQCARDGNGTDARGSVIGRKQLRRRPLNRIRRGKVGLAIREKSTMCRPNIHRIRRFRRRSWGRRGRKRLHPGWESEGANRARNSSSSFSNDFGYRPGCASKPGDSDWVSGRCRRLARSLPGERGGGCSRSQGSILPDPRWNILPDPQSPNSRGCWPGPAIYPPGKGARFAITAQTQQLPGRGHPGAYGPQLSAAKGRT